VEHGLLRERVPGNHDDRKKNGETLIIENVLTPQRDSSAEITHFISTFRDITERRRLESELQQAQRPDLKVLFVSGYAENTVLKHGTIDVATRFLQKPFSLKTLARKVREVLEASEASALATSSRDWGAG
jgi:response regulator RpfG family c-di-GMP phosphodiesterase